MDVLVTILIAGFLCGVILLNYIAARQRYIERKAEKRGAPMILVSMDGLNFDRFHVDKPTCVRVARLCEENITERHLTLIRSLNRKTSVTTSFPTDRKPVATDNPR